MKLLLSGPPRAATIATGWICQSCRAIKHFSSHAPKEYTSLSAASLELRRNGPARTRFAPSPTGFLHLGSLRTALLNYLVAKATGGQFLLRIEDTDQKRTIPGAEERLFQDLEWAGIEWDEGPRIGGPCGPYKQSQRTATYREHAEKLLHSGSAYRCFCSPERLHTLAEHRSKLGLPPDYDRKCAHIPREESDDRAAKGEAHVVRFQVPGRYPVFYDHVYGLVRRRTDMISNTRVHTSVNGSFEDPILLKSDGFPTYHLANVVDDRFMKISHVIRGAEWMSSTPKHLAIYQAFGWSPPLFAHVGLLLDKDRQKLSKRHGSIDVANFRDKMGVFPEALTNFVALLGWSHNESRDVMSMQDLIRNASMKYTRGDTVVSFEKLWFLQRRHAARYAETPQGATLVNPSHDLTELAVKPIVRLLDSNPELDRFPIYKSLPEGLGRENFIKSILWRDASSYTNPTEFIIRNTYFFVAPTPETLNSNIPSLKLHNVPAGITHSLSPETILLFFNNFSEIPEPEWNTTEIKSWINSIIEQGAMGSVSEPGYESTSSEEQESLVRKAWSKLVHQYLRWAISAGMPGPDGAETMKILGKEETIKRLERAQRVIIARYENDVEEAS